MCFVSLYNLLYCKVLLSILVAWIVLKAVSFSFRTLWFGKILAFALKALSSPIWSGLLSSVVVRLSRLPSAHLKAGTLVASCSLTIALEWHVYFPGSYSRPCSVVRTPTRHGFESSRMAVAHFPGFKACKVAISRGLRRHALDAPTCAFCDFGR